MNKIKDIKYDQKLTILMLSWMHSLMKQKNVLMNIWQNSKDVINEKIFAAETSQVGVQVVVHLRE